MRNNYNAIADEFSRTRENIPEDRKNLLLKCIKPGDRVLDVGCGNGRFCEALKNSRINYLGIDNSKEMIEIAKQRYPEADFQLADALSLPFPENSFDLVFSFAVIHHVPSEGLRLKFLTEARRVLKPQGILILAAWNLNPVKMMMIGEWGRAAQFLKYQLFKLIGVSKLDFGDFYVSWKNIIPRYIHFFTIAGFEKIVKKAGFKIKDKGVLKSPTSGESNIYLIAQK